MIQFTPAHPGDEYILGQLRQQCWAATYRGIYPDDMIDHFDFAWHAKHDLARINSPSFDVCIIRDSDTPIGYMVIRHSEPPLLYSLYLLPHTSARASVKKLSTEWLHIVMIIASLTFYVIVSQRTAMPSLFTNV